MMFIKGILTKRWSLIISKIRWYWIIFISPTNVLNRINLFCILVNINKGKNNCDWLIYSIHKNLQKCPLIIERRIRLFTYSNAFRYQPIYYTYEGGSVQHFITYVYIISILYFSAIDLARIIRN